MSDRRRKVTAAEFRHRLRYDAAAGELYWRKARERMRIGTVAGSISSDGYRQVRLGDRQYKVHRLVWFFETGAWPVGPVDHVNGNRLDNRFVNLRQATSGQNKQNGRRPRNNTTGAKGVSYIQRDPPLKRPWWARIASNGKRWSLGYYATLGEASLAYDAAAKELHGPFALLNASATKRDYLVL